MGSGALCRGLPECKLPVRVVLDLNTTQQGGFRRASALDLNVPVEEPSTTDGVLLLPAGRPSTQNSPRSTQRLPTSDLHFLYLSSMVSSSRSRSVVPIRRRAVRVPVERRSAVQTPVRTTGGEYFILIYLPLSYLYWSFDISLYFNFFFLFSIF